MKRRAFIECGAALAASTALPAWAADYPAHPIKIVQGYAAGGNADTIARVLGTEMSKTLGQPMLIDAQTGAGGNIAAAAVARAKPDGYTLLLAMGGHAIAGALYNTLSYRTVEDYEMVSTVMDFPFLLVVQAQSKYRSLRDILADARANPKGVAYGTAGIGTGHHLTGELLSKMAKAELLHVAYRGDSASATALLGGEVQLIIAPPTAVLSNIKAGKLRALAVTGAQRWRGLPEVATVSEQGVPGFDVRSWAGLMAPTNTPRPVIDRLNEEVRRALQVPAVRARLEDMGGDVRGSTPDEMKTMVNSQLQRWTQLVSETNIPKQ